jgi:tricorn protease
VRFHYSSTVVFHFLQGYLSIIDVGCRVENYGTDPDIEVDYTPQDYMAGRDPQLDWAIAEILRILEANPPKLPDFEPRPKLPLP